MDTATTVRIILIIIGVIVAIVLVRHHLKLRRDLRESKLSESAAHRRIAQMIADGEEELRGQKSR